MVRAAPRRPHPQHGVARVCVRRRIAVSSLRPAIRGFAGRSERIAPTYDAYFPAAAALHVLLDSFIDQAEDRDHGELNFASLYATPDRMLDRVADLARNAFGRIALLPNPSEHRFVLRVMALFYLTHPKVTSKASNARPNPS